MPPQSHCVTISFFLPSNFKFQKISNFCVNLEKYLLSSLFSSFGKKTSSFHLTFLSTKNWNIWDGFKNWMFLVDKVDKLYVFQRTPNWFFPRIEGNFSQWYKDLLRMFPFLMTLNFWALFALIEVQSLLWMRKGWTERYNVHVICIIF